MIFTELKTSIGVIFKTISAWSILSAQPSWEPSLHRYLEILPQILQLPNTYELSSKKSLRVSKRQATHCESLSMDKIKIAVIGLGTFRQRRDLEQNTYGDRTGRPDRAQGIARGRF
jgi:hypothetical protein